MRANGIDITAVTVPRAGGGVTGLATNNFWRTPSWNELRKMDMDARLNAIRDDSFRAKLVAEVRDNEPLNEQVMKATRGNANPSVVAGLIVEQLDTMKS